MAPRYILRCLEDIRSQVLDDDLASWAAGFFANDMNSNPHHFLLELLQNSDDNEYSNVDPTVELVYADHLNLYCNEKGFTEDHVRAICGVGKSTKIHSASSTGEKGIGFKSVFRIAEAVVITSGDWKFRLAKNSPFKPEPLDTDVHGPVGTGMRFSIRPDRKVDVQLAVEKFDPTTMLCLRKLRRICITSNGGVSRNIEKKEGPGDRNVSHITLLENEEATHHYKVLKFPAQLTARRPRANHRLESSGLETDSSTTIALAFPVTPDFGQLLISCENERVYACLPIKSIGLKFAIDADFVLSANREEIHNDLPWNLKLRDAIRDKIVEAITMFGNSDSPFRYDWPMLLESQAKSNDFLATAFNQVLELLKEHEILETEAGGFGRAGDLVYVPDKYRFGDSLEPPFTEDAARSRCLSRKYSAKSVQMLLSHLNLEEMSDAKFMNELTMFQDRLPSQPAEWHSILAKKIADNNMMHRAWNIKLIPTHGGPWVTYYQAILDNVFFLPDKADVDQLPGDIGLYYISTDALQDANRLDLFKKLRARDVSKPENSTIIARKIFDKHTKISLMSTKSTTRDLISHIRFLFRYQPGSEVPSGLWVATQSEQPQQAKNTFLPVSTDLRREWMQLCELGLKMEPDLDDWIRYLIEIKKRPGLDDKTIERNVVFIYSELAHSLQTDSGKLANIRSLFEDNSLIFIPPSTTRPWLKNGCWKPVSRCIWHANNKFAARHTFYLSVSYMNGDFFQDVLNITPSLELHHLKYEAEHLSELQLERSTETVDYLYKLLISIAKMIDAGGAGDDSNSLECSKALKECYILPIREPSSGNAFDWLGSAVGADVWFIGDRQYLLEMFTNAVPLLAFGVTQVEASTEAFKLLALNHRRLSYSMTIPAAYRDDDILKWTSKAQYIDRLVTESLRPQIMPMRLRKIRAYKFGTKAECVIKGCDHSHRAEIETRHAAAVGGNRTLSIYVQEGKDRSHRAMTELAEDISTIFRIESDRKLLIQNITAEDDLDQIEKILADRSIPDVVEWQPYTPLGEAREKSDPLLQTSTIGSPAKIETERNSEEYYSAEDEIPAGHEIATRQMHQTTDAKNMQERKIKATKIEEWIEDCEIEDCEDTAATAMRETADKEGERELEARARTGSIQDVAATQHFKRKVTPTPNFQSKPDRDSSNRRSNKLVLNITQQKTSPKPGSTALQNIPEERPITINNRTCSATSIRTKTTSQMTGRDRKRSKEVFLAKLLRQGRTKNLPNLNPVQKIQRSSLMELLSTSSLPIQQMAEKLKVTPLADRIDRMEQQVPQSSGSKTSSNSQVKHERGTGTSVSADALIRLTKEEHGALRQQFAVDHFSGNIEASMLFQQNSQTNIFFVVDPEELPDVYGGDDDDSGTRVVLESRLRIPMDPSLERSVYTLLPMVTGAYDKEADLLGQIWVSYLFSGYLNPDYKPEKHWTNPFCSKIWPRTQPAVGIVPFEFHDRKGRVAVTSFLEKSSTIMADFGIASENPPTYYIDVITTVESHEQPTELSVDRFHKARKYRIPRKLSSPNDLFIFIRISNINAGGGPPKIGFYVDPWELHGDGKIDAFHHHGKHYIQFKGEPHFWAQPQEPTVYSWKKLDSRGKIRLLELKQGLYDEELVGRFVEYDFHAGDSLPQYTAISYAWGSAIKPFTLRIDDDGYKGNIQVPTSLYLALGRLRRYGLTRVWADAVCIDQNCSLEKERQIQMLSTTFQKAQSVFAWIGDDEDGSDEAMQFLSQIGDLVLTYRSAINNPEPATSLPDFPEIPHITDRRWPSIIALLKRSWFTRIWTVQEAILPQHLTLGCGGQKIPWETFHAAISFCFLDGIFHPNIKTVIADDATKRNVLQIDHYREWARGRKGRVVDMFQLLQVFHQKKVTKPRDRLFALLGLAHDRDEREFQPDYEATEEAVILRYAVAFVRQGYALDLLSQARLAWHRPGLPSWLPRLTASAYPQTVASWGKCFNAGGKMSVQESGHCPLRTNERQSTVKNDILILDGYKIDHIQDIGQAPSHVSNFLIYLREVLSTIEATYKVQESPLKEKAMRELSVGGPWDSTWNLDGEEDPMVLKMKREDAYKAFRQYLSIDCTDWLFEKQLVKEATFGDNILSEEGNLRKRMWPYLSTAMKFANIFRPASAVVCKTNKNRVGIVPQGPDCSKPGDEIVIFQGAKVPHIVRRLSNSDKSGVSPGAKKGDYCIVDVEKPDSGDNDFDHTHPGGKRPKVSKSSSCAGTSSQSSDPRGPTAQGQQLQTRTQTSGHSIRSQLSRETPIPPVTELFAQFEEQPLGGAVLQRITEGSKTIFQLQFEWDATSCQPHGHSSMPHLKRKKAARYSTFALEVAV
ncbi:hypothetical protein NW768_011096 [Fusarium equiseti]|uniref:Heterokaryon incompatibility domain-containing protein n=1 Tax=Fusarium equiseti TaxID=61235 RepID=A0ABQ8QYD4_FUSEQ|nr:hypothetical protein NW768_011096 [Fusarium equiseti]